MCDCNGNVQICSMYNLLFWFSPLEELYQQMLAKALAHYFEAKLLLLDITDFSLKVYIHKLLGLFFFLLVCSFLVPFSTWTNISNV